jgi:hypothetical protein
MKEEKVFLFGEWEKAKRNALTAKNPPVFHLNFPTQHDHAILSAKKKLRGFEHAHLKQRSEKANLSTFLGQTHLGHGEKRSREKETEEIFSLHVYTRIR